MNYTRGRTADDLAMGHEMPPPAPPTMRWRAALRGGAILIMVLLVCACSDLAVLPPAEPTVYRLGSGDQIRVITYGDDHLSGTFRVGDGGEIAVPLLGQVEARGKSTTELSAALQDLLRARKLMQTPNVSVEIVTYRPVFIIGEVAHPGRYPYEPGMTVLTVVAEAGGFTYRARQEQVVIERHTGGAAVMGKAPGTAWVSPADVITVEERFF